MIEAVVASFLLFLGGVGISRRLLPAATLIEHTLAGAVVGFTFLVLGMEILGSFSLLNRTNLGGLALLAGILGMVTGWCKTTSASQQESASWFVAGIASILVSWCVLGAHEFLAYGLAAPVAPVSDGPIYHLPIAMRFVQSGSLERIATPFGELAATYFPANGNLWLAWLKIWTGDETLAKVGQWPFLPLIGFTLFALCRRLGGSVQSAMVPGCLWSLCSLVGPTSALPIVDLIYSAWFLIAVLFLVIAAKHADEVRLGPLAICGLALGNALGTKSIAIATTPLLILVGFWLARRGLRQSVIFLLCIVAPMAYWYARNWVETGNPLYPLNATLLGVTVFPGWYSAETMRATSNYHVPPLDLSLAKQVLAPVAHPALWLIWGASILFGLAAGLSSRFRTVAMISILTVVYFAICWFVIPYNTQQRFMLPALALGFVPLGCLAGFWSWIALLITAAAAFATTGRIMLNAVNDFAVLAFVLIPVWVAQRWPDRTAVGLLFLVPIVVVTSGWMEARRTTVSHSKIAKFYPVSGFAAQLLPAWMVLERDAKDQSAVVAYAGTNLPYYLSGPNFLRRPMYVNINGSLDWLPHDFHQQRLQAGIHELAATAWPQWHRENPDFDVWLSNLRECAARYLFVARENFHGRKDSPEVAPFPVEYRWAVEHPEIFERLGPPPGIDEAWGVVFRIRN